MEYVRNGFQNEFDKRVLFTDEKMIRLQFFFFFATPNINFDRTREMKHEHYTRGHFRRIFKLTYTAVKRYCFKRNTLARTGDEKSLRTLINTFFEITF